jgi:integrase
MAGELATIEQQPAALATIGQQVRDYIRASKAENTLRAYQSDWQHFAAWCQAQGLPALPAAPETVAAYLAAHAEEQSWPAGTQKALSVATLQRRLVAIGQAHKAAGLDDPAKAAGVKATWQGIRRAKGVAQRGKAPAVTDTIRRMVGELPEGILGQRDRALLLLGFAGAFRRSELVAIDREDVTFSREGAVVTVRRSKTDQEGAGQKKGIPYGSRPDTCPVRALQDWIETAGITTGPLFRPLNRHGQVLPGRLSDKGVARVVKRYAEAAGMDPSQYAGHSLRAGLATSAAAAGISERAIMAQTGHRSERMVRRYIRDGSLFRENAAAGVGL